MPVGPRVLVPAFTMVNLTPAEEKSTESTIVELVNRARIEEGLEPLSVNRKLTEAARIHAGDMARLNEMEHNLPQADQPTLKDRIRFVEYQYGYVGENIAYNQSGRTAAVMKSWMKSPGHKANILSSHFVEIGVAVAFNDEGEPYYCQVFGSPDSIRARMTATSRRRRSRPFLIGTRVGPRSRGGPQATRVGRPGAIE